MPAKPLDRRSKGRPSLHVQIAGDLRSRIEKGEFREGTEHRLPPQHQFVEQYQVSKDTITKAYDLLKTQGVVVSYQGSEPVVQDARHWRLPDPQRLDALETRVGKGEDSLREVRDLAEHLAAKVKTLESKVRTLESDEPRIRAGRAGG